jgi:periplasmic divalent cation tolerance protein
MDAARGVAVGLVGQGLAACVNLMPGMRSVYRWDGAIQEDGEIAGLIKTRAALAERVMGFVRVAHPYRIPALVVLPTAGGHAPFLDWIGIETAGAVASKGEV